MVVAIVPLTFISKRIPIIAHAKAAELLLIGVAVQELLQPTLPDRGVFAEDTIFHDKELA